MDGSGKKVTCSVTVYIVSVSSIQLSHSSISLTPGNTAQITATVSPTNATNKTVTWSSSNTSVATVSSTGKVTAVAVGEATITCSATDGSGVTATCDVTSYLDNDYVDLDLTSGTLWATMNLGASDQTGSGSYFAWGETASKSYNNYSWSSYK